MIRIALEQHDLTLKEVAKLLRDGPIVVTHPGQPVMAVIPLDESEAEAWILGKNEELMALAEQSRQELREEGGLSLDEMRKELELDENP